MKTLLALFLCATSAIAQVQLGKGVQVGGVGTGSSPVTSIVPGTNVTCTPNVSGKCVGDVTVNSSASGSGTVSGQASGVVPLATGSTVIGAQSHITDNGSQVTVALPFGVNDGTGHGGGFANATEGTVPTAGSSYETLWADSSSHRWKFNPNNAGAFFVPGIASAGTSGHCLQLAANGIDIVDAGSACGGGGSVNVNGSPVSSPNINDTTPAAGANGLNVTWQVSGSDVSGEIVGDGNAAHYLDGTGAFSTPAGSMVYPPGNGIPTVNTGGTAWSVTIPQIPIENYGAVGYSSYAAMLAGTDSTTALQNCINALEAGPTTGQCLGEAKWYKITAPIVINTAGVGFAGTYSNTVGTSPNVTSIISTSATADIFTVQGPNIGAQINANKFNDFQIGRSVQPTGTAKGMDFIYTNFAHVNNVTSNDSIYDWYFHGNSAGRFTFDAGFWGLISPVESGPGPYYAFYLDSANGEPNNSMAFYGSGGIGGPGTGEYDAISSQGAAINDIWTEDLSASNMTNGVVDIYTGSGSPGTCYDMHYRNSIIDQAKVNAYYFSGFVPGCTASVEVSGGTAASGVSGSVAVEILNSSGISVRGVQLLAVVEGVKIEGTSTYNTITDNHFLNGPSTGISLTASSGNTPNTLFPNTFESSITTQIASANVLGLGNSPSFHTASQFMGLYGCSNSDFCVLDFSNDLTTGWLFGINGPSPSVGSVGAAFFQNANTNHRPFGLTDSGIYGLPTAPTGACTENGTWVFSQDGKQSFCNTTWGEFNPAPLYNVSGTLQTSAHTVRGTSAAMSGGSVTVTLSGSAVFTSNSTYSCTANENVSGVIYQPIGVTYTSGSSVTFNNDSSDTATVTFICTGN